MTAASKTRAAVFAVQRQVAEFADEPLMAVLPGVALDELWEVVGIGEKALLGMSIMVAIVSLAGLVSVARRSETSAAANSPCCAPWAPGRATWCCCSRSRAA